jgi:hypothetical protein
VLVLVQVERSWAIPGERLRCQNRQQAASTTVSVRARRGCAWAELPGRNFVQVQVLCSSAGMVDRRAFTRKKMQKIQKMEKLENSCCAV